MTRLTQRLGLHAVGLAMAVSLAGVGGVVATTTSIAATTTMVTTVYVNFRTGPSTSYSAIKLLSPGITVQATGVTSGSWSQVIYDGRTGWVYSSYIEATGTSSTSTATTTSTVNVRSGPSTSYSIVGVAYEGTKVETTGRTSGGWTQVIWNGTERWISSSYLSVAPSYSAPVSTDTRVQAAINYALAQVGDDYVWAAEGPDAFDCSGLTMMAMRQAGVSLPHYSGYQSEMGTYVSRDNLKPGDLIFWYTPVAHVSIYIGNGEMVHARNTTYGVVRQSVSSYPAPWHSARRYIS